MATGRARVAASILDADLSNLAYAVRRVRLEMASAAALRGQRSEEPVPAGVDG